VEPVAAARAAARPAPPVSSLRPAPAQSGAVVSATAGPAHDALLARIAEAAAACRKQRTPLSLLLLELDRASELELLGGAERVQGLIDVVERLCAEFDHPGTTCLRTRRSRIAVVMPDCDRQRGVEIGRQLRAALLEASARRNLQAATASVGVSSVSLPGKNFPSDELLASADRCLRGVQCSGGDAVKSIEIY
jgi:GGDEF domain-containing protein